MSSSSIPSFESMGIKELKNIIRENGGSLAGCIQKSDLVKEACRCYAAAASGPPLPPPSAPDSDVEMPPLIDGSILI